jgi:hypothetical protein
MNSLNAKTVFGCCEKNPPYLGVCLDDLFYTFSNR